MLSGCPFCHHSESSPYRERQQLRKGSFGNILRCHECGTLYPQMRMDEKETKNSPLQTDQYNPDSLLLEDPRIEFSPNSWIVTFLNEVEKQGRSLDIGTWTGRNTYFFKALGFDSYGLEPQKKAAAFGRGKGLKVLRGSFPDNVPPKLLSHKYHLIAMFEMIYYLQDLKKSLLKVKQMLEDDGVLFILAHQGYSKYYDYDYQNSYFSRYGDYVQGIPTLSSLQYCLDKAGFKVIKSAGITEESVQKKLNCTTVTMESADRLFILAGKAC